jgi:ketosteroid isomerase-like protein
MSHANVEVVRRVTDVMDRESFEAALPVFVEVAHPDVVWREDPAWPGADTYRGLDEVRRTIFDRLESLDFEQETEELLPADDKVVALVRWHGRGRASGAQSALDLAVVYTVHDGAITKVEFYLDRAEALAAAGLTD